MAICFTIIIAGKGVVRYNIVFLAVVLSSVHAFVYARVLRIDNTTVELFENCTTEHKLNVSFGNELWCAPLTTTWADNSLHVTFNGTTYTTCGTSCNGTTPEDEVPEIPPEPVVIEDENCEWSQTNSNAYLLSDGNQYFDTGVGVDSEHNVELTADIINGVSAPLMGTVNSDCFYDVTINNSGIIYFRIGTVTSSASLKSEYNNPVGKHTYLVQNQNGSKNKTIYVDEVRAGNKTLRTDTMCEADDTIHIFKNSHIPSVNSNLANSGGMKVYSIKLWNSSGTLLHEYQPVAKGTNICGYIAPQNGMWDKVTKKFYLAGGSGVMRYGVDE